MAVKRSRDPTQEAKKTAICQHCGHRCRGRYDQKTHRVRDLSVAGWRIYLEFKRWRIRCPRCDGVHVEHLDWLAKNPPIERCYADGAYDRWQAHRLSAYPPAAQQPSIEAIIPPCEPAQIQKSKRRYRHIEARNQRVTRMRKVGRKKWKQHSGYHRRSLVETTTARFKRIIGPQLQAREWNRQKVEVQIGMCYTQSNNSPGHAAVL